MFYHVILTTECNGKCYYCYEKSLDDMEENFNFEIDYDVPLSLSYKLEDLKKFIMKDDNPTITFYGGEPTLRPDLIKKIMDMIDARYMIQTNGLLLNILPTEYLNRFHTILVSIDGDEKTTDKYRGKGNYRIVIENLKRIVKNGFRGEIIARMTIEEQDIYKQVKYLVENDDFKFTSVHWQLDANFWEHDYQKRNFLQWVRTSYNPGITKLVNYWIEKMKEGKVLKLYPFLDLAYDFLHGIENTFLRCGSGYTNFTILTNGVIVACPIMVGLKDFYLGDIWRTYPKDLKMKYEWKEPCKSCELFNICGGRCLYGNYMQPWGEKGFLEVCETVKHLINTIKSKIPEIKEMIKKGIIKIEDFDHVKYNGCEIIP